MVVEDITPAEFVERRGTDNRQQWQLLDVREPWELDIVAVAGALSIPMAEVPTRLHELDAERPVAVLCRSGVRSGQIGEFLQLQGFAEIVNIAGGINLWAETLDETMKTY